MRLEGATAEQGSELRALLAGLTRPGITDADLLRLLGTADSLVDERGRLRSGISRRAA
jgi:hypothetical protein